MRVFLCDPEVTDPATDFLVTHRKTEGESPSVIPWAKQDGAAAACPNGVGAPAPFTSTPVSSGYALKGNYVANSFSEGLVRALTKQGPASADPRRLLPQVELEQILRQRDRTAGVRRVTVRPDLLGKNVRYGRPPHHHLDLAANSKIL